MKVYVYIQVVSAGTHFQVSKMGFGCMGLTGVYNAPIAEEDVIAIIKYAFDQGITFFDTADVYGATTNEVLVGKVHIQHNLLAICFPHLNTCPKMSPVH